MNMWAPLITELIDIQIDLDLSKVRLIRKEKEPTN